jgi:hypothetical protein
MIKFSTHIFCLLFIASFVGCSSPPPVKTVVSQIRSFESGDMSKISRIGNVWLSEQPTEEDLIWLRDNFVTVIIDTRMRSDDRGFDERAYVVSLGMGYRCEPLNTKMDYSIDYFDRIRETLVARRSVPTFIHGETADYAAAVWLPFRVLDDRVPYSQALAEAKIAGLSEPNTIRIVNQYLLSNGVDIGPQEVEVTSTPGPDEMNFEVLPVEEKKDETSNSSGAEVNATSGNVVRE